MTDMPAAKDSKPAASLMKETTTVEEESVTPAPQPAGLGELAAAAVVPAARAQGAMQRAQVSSLEGTGISEEPRDRATKRNTSPVPAPKKYALELWVEIEVSPGMYGTPEDDSYGADFVIETINQAYPGCTGMYLDVAGHMLAFFGKKANSKVGLLHEQSIQASQAIASIPTWMGYPTIWRVRCISMAEANEIVMVCKRLQKENWRQARWELQNRFSA